jgi:hypothetical protein
MKTDYAGTDFKKAEQKLKKGIALCGSSDCSETVVARLHVALATVYIAGTKQVPKGKAELKLALAADPDVQLDNDLATSELREAFTDAGGHGPKSAEDSPAASADTPPDESDSKPEEPAEPPPSAPESKGQKNWLSIHFEQDFLVYGAQNDTCASYFNNMSDAPNYGCFQSGSQFGHAPGQDIQPGVGNHVASGVGRATSRLLLGFDRVLGSNFSLGARVGIALGGGPASIGGKFLPFHAEIRGNYWFGTEPFESSGLRPYVSLSAGVAEVDGHVLVEYYDLNGDKGSLDAWRKTGDGFLGLGFGLMIPFAGSSSIIPEVRLMEMLGSAATGFDFALGYAYGF